MYSFDFIRPVYRLTHIYTKSVIKLEIITNNRFYSMKIT